MAASNTYVLLTEVLPLAIKKYGGFDADALRRAALSVDLSEGGTMLGSGVKFGGEETSAPGNVLPYQHDMLPFDPKRDLNPIASVSEVVLAVSTPLSMNVNSIDELVAMARAQPGKLNAAAANGISDFLLFGFFKSMGLEIVRLPYRDIMQAPNDLAESRIQALSTSLAVVQPLSKAGRIRVLAVTSRQRAPSAPDVPTATEAGYPALTFSSIGGLFGPRGMPDKLRENIAADVQKAAEDPIIAQRLGDTGQIMSALGPADFGARVQEQRDTLATLAKTLGIKAQ